MSETHRPQAEDAGETQPPLEGKAGPSGPLVFISHDSRDAAVAEAFSKLLSSVSAGMLKTFRSSDKKGSQGFEYGVEWYPELMNRLESACDVVCLLTEHSLNRPWLLYEAGVAKGKLSIPVHGVALGVPLARANTGPFAQFHNCDDELDSLTKLVVQLVRRLPHADPDEDFVASQVEVFRSTLSSALDEGDEDGPPDLAVSEPTAKLFEEIKVMFQDLPLRLEGLGTRERHRRRRFHPGMLDELIHFSSRGDRTTAGTAALILGSLFRDDLPWLHDMGAAAYEASLAGNAEVERRAVENFLAAVEAVVRGPFGREFVGSPELDMLLHEAPMFLRHYVAGEGPDSSSG